MNEIDPFICPEIKDEDVEWVTSIMRNPGLDFFGENGLDPRLIVLKSNETKDVAACPGSGKTTLLVAKLAILANKWPYQTRGICVLSHTNAARYEIETRLGTTLVGRRLLSYPHFIGTIHGFVNEFLALPWLKSQGYSIKTIDDEIVEKQRRNLLNRNSRYKDLKIYIRNNEKYQKLVNQFYISSSDFDVLKDEGKPVFKTPGKAAGQLKMLVEEVARAGYFRHNEMFVWGNDLLTNFPRVINFIRQRFPLLYIDEAQDNSEIQSSILHKIFVDGEDPVIRQRFGDSNQAIYNFIQGEGATTDLFPDIKCKIDLPDSHRYSQNIACLANPLGQINYDMKGKGPKTLLDSGDLDGKHTIFIFDEGKIESVIDSFAALIFNTFSKQELKEGTFTAIGLVHRRNGDNKIPRHVGHYWTDYNSAFTKKDPKPKSFIEHIIFAQGKSDSGDDVNSAVEILASGILRLASMGKDSKTFPRRRYTNRYILSLLDPFPEIMKVYEEFLLIYAAKKEPLTKGNWEKVWREKVKIIAERIAEECLSNRDAIDFLEWRGFPENNATPIPKQNNNNISKHYSEEGKEVSIQIGSIHSIKGETHTATLVLETFWHKHNIEDIFRWLDGRESGFNSANKRQKTRLRAHYVAMTRPTHLLCMAAKRTTLEDKNGMIDQSVKRLEEHGWSVKIV